MDDMELDMPRGKRIIDLSRASPSLVKLIYIYIPIYHTHTHTYIYIYQYVS